MIFRGVYMNVYTIGFTEKSAQTFFSLLRRNGVVRVVDVRLNNVSQLSGFTKKNDLIYFLKELCNADYIHVPELTPTKLILDAYKNKEMTWDIYADKFTNLMAQRNIEKSIDKQILDGGCLLCSEHLPHHCHRKIVVDYLNRHWGMDLKVTHLI